MRIPDYFDPLDHLANAKVFLLSQEPVLLRPIWDKRPGVYLLSYVGDHVLYTDIRGLSSYIYVGVSEDDLGQRLRDHFKTLTEVWDLEVADFMVRYLAVPSDYALGLESRIVRDFNPRWNQKAYSGFGNHQSTSRNRKSASNWDLLHPGRVWALALERSSDKEMEVKREIERRKTLGLDTFSDPIADLFGE